MFCNYDSAVEDLSNCNLSSSEACSTLLGWLVKLMMLQSWHCPRLPFFGRGITSDLVHSVGHFFCSQIFWHRAVSAFTVPSTPLHISSEGMSSIPGYLSVFIAASTSPSVPADCPHFQCRTGWFVVLNRRCRVHCCMSTQYHAHLISNPSSSVISLLHLSSMTAAIC